MIADLEAQIRTACGKGVARRLRAQGKVPAVLYGRGREPRPLTIDSRQLGRLLTRSTRVVNVNYPDESGPVKRQALIKEVQYDPIRVDDILHLDLHEIAAGQKIDVTVPVRTTGQPAGLVEGGVFARELREITVRCLPQDIPREFLVDVAPLQIGDSILVRDLPLPEGVEAVTDGHLLVAHVMTPRGGLDAEDEETAAEAAEVEGSAADIEVIAKGKEEKAEDS